MRTEDGRPDTLASLAEFDRRLYEAVAEADLGAADRVLPRLSELADNSKLWLGASAAIAALGGRRGRATALRALAALGATSLIANLVAKPLWRRRRPPQSEIVPADRHVAMPTSTSFPSGHSASAAAFVVVVAHGMPALLPLAAPLGAAVAFSRIHSGVHYPADVAAGAAIGLAVAAAVTTTVPVGR